MEKLRILARSNVLSKRTFLSMVCYFATVAMALAEVAGTPVMHTRAWACVYTVFTSVCFVTEVVGLVLVKREVNRDKTVVHAPEHFTPMEMYGFAIVLTLGIATGLCWSFDKQYNAEQHQLFDLDRYHTSTPTFDYRMFMQWMVIQAVVISALPILLSLCWFAMKRHENPKTARRTKESSESKSLISRQQYQRNP